MSALTHLSNCQGRLWPTIALAKWLGDLKGSLVHMQFTCDSQLCVSQAFLQHLVQSNDSALPQPKLSISAWPHLLRTQTLVVELSLCRLYHWCKKNVWWRNADFSRSNDSSGNSTAITPNHSWQAQYYPYLQKSGCMPFAHPKVGCYIVHICCFQRQQHSHHCG